MLVTFCLDKDQIIAVFKYIQKLFIILK